MRGPSQRLARCTVALTTVASLAMLPLAGCAARATPSAPRESRRAPADNAPRITLAAAPGAMLLDRYIAKRKLGGAPAAALPVTAVRLDVVATLDGWPAVTQVDSTLQFDGYFPVSALVADELADLPRPPMQLPDASLMAAEVGCELELHTIRPDDGELVALRLAQRPGELAAVVNRRPVKLAVTRGQVRLPEPEARLFDGEQSAAGGTWVVWDVELTRLLGRAARGERHTPREQADPILTALAASADLPLQDRVSLPGVVGRLAARNLLQLRAGTEPGASPQDAYNALFAIALASNVPAVGRANALRAIGLKPEPQQAALILSTLRPNQPGELIETAAYIAGVAKLAEAGDMLWALRTRRAELRDVTAYALSRLDDERLLQELTDRLADRRPLSAHELVALSRYGDDLGSAGAELAELCTTTIGSDPDPLARHAAAVALARLPADAAALFMTDLLNDHVLSESDTALFIGRLADTGDRARLLAVLNSSHQPARALARSASRALTPPATSLLVDLATDPVAPLRQRREALLTLYGMPPAGASLDVDALPKQLREHGERVMQRWQAAAR